MTYNVYHIDVKYFDWDEEKNRWLISRRNISFELIKDLIEAGCLLDVVDNHPPYEHQRVFMVQYIDYVYEVPFVEDEEKIFLKTAYPSRKSTLKYLLE